MPSLPRELYRAADVRRFDERAIHEHAIPAYTLMQRAGAAAFALLRGRWPNARRIAVVCGAGNNAGDGFVLARLAHVAGLRVLVHCVGGTALHDAAARAWQDLCAAGITANDSLGYCLERADVVVDALFGTGLDRPVEGAFRDAIEAVNGSGRPVLALDIPSGLHADTGTVLGVAIRAAATISFIGLKRGLVTGQAREHVGSLHFANLEVPADVYRDTPPSARRHRLSDARALLAPRSRAAHKGAFGHVLVIGGGEGMLGAARLAGEAALRVGAGLVSVATWPAHAVAMAAARPELMCAGIGDRAALQPLLARASVVAVGPGLGRSPWANELWNAALDSGRPLVVDADALNALAADPLRRDDWVLTPHPGEAARLLGRSAAEVEHDRYAAVQALHERYGGTVLLKGAGTLVCDGAGPVSAIETGNPGMATGGMGDVLTGAIAGLIAQGLAPAAAACAAACLHGAAGDRAAAQGGERGMMATDLLGPLRRLVNPA